ncbi:MAG TPA: MASE1 domain-containing protein, partial [Verrucomicrobiae bacterium]
MNRLTAAKPSWITVLAFAAGFFLTAELGRVVSLKGTSYVSFWLPAGLYMGILLVHHPRYWPIFIQAVLPVNLLFDLRHGTPLATTLGFYLANTTEAVIGAWLTRRFMAGQPRLQSLQDLYGLIAGSAVISTVAGAMVGAVTMKWSAMAPSFGRAFVMWWCSEAMAIILVAPFLLVWWPAPGKALGHFFGRRRLIEVILLAGIMVVATGAMLKGNQDTFYTYKTCVLPLLLWAGLRFGLAGATVANLWLAFLIGGFAYYAVPGYPGGGLTMAGMFLQIQCFMLVAAVVSLVPAIFMEDRERQLAALAASRETMSKAFNNSPLAVVITDHQTGRILESNDKFAGFFDLAAERLVGATALELAIWAEPAQRDKYLEALQKQGAIQDWEIVCHNAKGVRLELSVNAVLVAIGGRRCIISTFQEITRRKQI